MIIAVDFDGTLSYGDYPNCGRPNQVLIDWLKERKSDGDKLILWTCRHDETLKRAVEWCDRQGLEFDAINENLPEMVARYGETRKVGADYYIDDTHYTSDYITKHTKSHRARRFRNRNEGNS